MFEGIINFFKNLGKKDQEPVKSKDAAKERLHLVLMQDRANVSADFLDLMKQEIIEVIKKYIDVDENAIDVRLTNKANGDGTTGAPALYANIPIVSIKEEVKSKMARQSVNKVENKVEDKVEEKEQNMQNEEKEEQKPEVVEEVKEEENETKTTEVEEKEEQSVQEEKEPTEQKESEVKPEGESSEAQNS